MSYTLNGIDIYTTYGIRAGHSAGSNIAMRGVYDMPKRTGTTFKDWGDSDGVEPWVNAGEMMFAGRDITFTGFIVGADVALNAAVSGFYNAIDSATGISVFETPYNSASGYVKSVTPRYMNGGCTLEMTFREPVVALTGTLPATGAGAYTIDSIPFSSFGLYLTRPDGLHDLPENKEQLFTRYRQEGYQIVKRKHKTLEMNGFVMGSSLSDFTGKVEALYKVFSSAGTRTIVLNTITTVECFATEGFKIENVHYHNNGVIGRFRINLMIKGVTYYAVPSGDYDADLLTYISGLATELSADILGKINTFVAGYKSDDGLTNLSDAYDFMYYLGNETAESSLRNLVKRAHDATAVNAPTFTAYEGFAGDGISSYIDSNYNPATEADNLAQNDAHLSIYLRNDVTTNYVCGCITAPNGTICPKIATTNKSYHGINGANANEAGTNPNDSRGMWVTNRNNSTQCTLSRNKVSLGTATRDSTGVSAYNYLILAVNNAGNPAYNNLTAQASFLSAGKSLTTVDNLYDRFQALMTANGKQV